MTTGRFHGAFTALVTPFKNGKIDEEAYREFIEWQIEQGIDGLVPCGTTGESATMTHDEHEAAIRICVEQVNKRVPVIAGAGSNNTREAIPLTQFAKNVGADAALHITPYYNKPTQEGLYQHFKTICSEVSMPVILYNVPGRTGCNMLPPTVMCPMSWASRKPLRISSMYPTSWNSAPKVSRSSPATTSPCCPTSPWAAAASSP